MENRPKRTGVHFQRRDQIDVGGSERGCQPKQDSREHGHGHCEAQYAKVGLYIEMDRNQPTRCN